MLSRPNQCPHSVRMMLHCHISEVSCGTTAISPAAQIAAPHRRRPKAVTPTLLRSDMIDREARRGYPRPSRSVQP